MTTSVADGHDPVHPNQRNTCNNVIIPAAGDLVAAAADWRQHGYAVNPIKGGDGSGRKRPYGKDWQSGRLSWKIIEPMLRTGSHPGFGVVCGEPSGQLEALDVEGRMMVDSSFLADSRLYAEHRGILELLLRVSHGYSETVSKLTRAVRVAGRLRRGRCSGR